MPIAPLAQVALVAFSLTALAACGGRTLERDTDGGTRSPTGSQTPDNPPSDDGGSSASPGNGNTPFPICPENAPGAGWSCPTPYQGCAYVDVKANTCASYTCDSSGHWTVSTPAGCPAGAH